MLVARLTASLALGVLVFACGRQLLPIDDYSD